MGSTLAFFALVAAAAALECHFGEVDNLLSVPTATKGCHYCGKSVTTKGAKVRVRFGCWTGDPCSGYSVNIETVGGLTRRQECCDRDRCNAGVPCHVGHSEDGAPPADQARCLYCGRVSMAGKRGAEYMCADQGCEGSASLPVPGEPGATLECCNSALCDPRRPYGFASLGQAKGPTLFAAAFAAAKKTGGNTAAALGPSLATLGVVLVAAFLPRP